MITVIISAIEGPILSAVSGCLGESGMQRLWLWNLVPTQVNMLSSDVPRTAEHPMVSEQGFIDYSGNLCRA